MNLKIYMLMIPCALLWYVNEIDAQILKCDYSYEYHSTTGYKNTNDSYYKCNLNVEEEIFDENLTGIDDQHESGHTDHDVEYLGNNKGIKLETFSSIFCQKFPNLKVIDISGAELESIDEYSVLNCKNLEHLSFEGCDILEIPNKFLIGNSNLIRLMIWNNQLTTLPEYIFLNQIELEELILHQNQINFLPSNIFRPLVELVELYLSGNMLQSIDSEWFVNLKNLKWLGLDGNQITEIPSKLFAQLSNLEILWLSGCQIKTLNPDSFDGLHNLQKLQLFDNEISELPANVFTPLKNLKELHLTYNKLTTIHSDSFGVYNQLAGVYLQDNKINEIDEKFIDNTAVTILNMTNNICSTTSFEFRNKKGIKLNIKKCFENYQPRIQSELRSSHQILNSNSNAANSCGKSMTGQGNIIGGTQITRGSFPWIATLVLITGNYFCGGSLITNRKVITAAHCMQEKHAATPISAGEFAVLLGAHDLKRFIEVGRVTYAVQKISIHPDWNPLIVVYDADIAVLVLDQYATFSEYIQPICLVNPGSNIAALTTGVVVGYGKSEDETKVHENIPKILETPIHSNEDCFLKNLLLVKLSSKRTFCGGTGNGTGVCRGDSGGGLFVTDGSVFYLRGVVSSSLIDGRYGCDVDAYSVFTDVTKYTDWIDGISTNRFD